MAVAVVFVAAACGDDEPADGASDATTTVVAATTAPGTTAPVASGAPTSAAASFPVYPVDAEPFGLTYGDWVAEWWQWAIRLPRSGHPLDQSGDVDCGVGREGEPVWFLGGVVTVSGTLTRRCTVPADVALFFPLINTECSTLEQPPYHGDDEATLRACSEAFGLTQLHAAIDNAEIPASTLAGFAVTSPMFTIDVPAENILLVPGPTTGQSVGHGIHLLVPALEPGEHLLRFGGVITGVDMTLDITYEITVAG
jgi:hypothetical protein